MTNIGSLREPSYPNIFIIDRTIWTLYANTHPKPLQQRLYFLLTYIPLQPLLFTPPPQYTNVFSASFNRPSLVFNTLWITLILIRPISMK